jgi:hypothetical protein
MDSISPGNILFAHAAKRSRWVNGMEQNLIYLGMHFIGKIYRQHKAAGGNPDKENQESPFIIAAHFTDPEK